VSVLDLRLPSPLTELYDDRVAREGVRLYLKRDDLIHPEFPGNKWRKLKRNLAAARGHRRLLTFGGAYSNHVRAVAAAGHHLGVETVGVIRGEEHSTLNPSLAYAVRLGMRLVYLDRTTYRGKTDPAVLDPLVDRYGPCYVIPEGGSNPAGVRGCAELPAELTVEYDVLCCATGTGTTLAGIAAVLPGHARAIGFAVLKGAQYLEEEVRRLQEETFGAATTNWTVDHSAHAGGYARRTPALDAFAADFEARHHITLDPVYEAKMMNGLTTRIAEGAFAPGTSIVAILS
jgi:1-aminocyclopropane-1-carboxylate deaminase